MLDSFKKAEESLKELEIEANRKQKEFWDKFHSLESKKITVDDEMLKEWLEEYWLLYRNPENSEEWFVAVPKFLDFSIGWLDHTTKGYNVFVINKYTQWLGELPDFLRKEVKIEPAKKITLSDDNLKFEEGTEEDIKEKFGQFLTNVGRGTARVKKGKEFDLLAQIIDSGSLPFIPNPVLKSDLREPQVNFKFDGKFNFQKEGYETFLKYGAVGFYWMTGAGKSFEAMHILDTIKGNKALFVPSLTLIEQWKEYFKLYAPRLLDEVELLTYQSYNKVKHNEYAVIGFDECHVLPADTFSKLATLKTKYRFGLCLHPRTNITLESGNIIELRQLIKKLKAGQKIKVLTYNENSKKVESKPILNFYEKEMKELLRISIKTKRGIRQIVCSPDHKFYINGSYIPASQLKIWHKVVIANQPHSILNNPSKLPDIRAKISLKLTGKQVSSETKEKLRIINQKKWKEEGYREHQSLVHKGQKSYLKGKSMEEYFGKEKADLIKRMIGIKSKEAINNQFKELLILKKDFEKRGFKFIPLVKVIPDAIAIKNNKIFAIELEHKTPRYEKYDRTQGFDDVIWIIKKGRRNTLC